MRPTAVIVAVCALATGCTVTTGGTVVAAPTLGHVPAPLAVGALEGLLLDDHALDTIMDATGLTVIHSGNDMYTNHTPDDECLAAWVNVHQDVYSGSGWSGMRRQDLRESADAYEHIVFQSVVSFPDALTAHDEYAKQVASWARCDNKRLNERNLNDQDDPDNFWTLSASKEQDGVLTMVRVAEGGDGWSCQRALTTANNVVVDVDACADNISDQGAQIAKQIAQKVIDKE